MSEEIIPTVMGNDEFTLYEGLYGVVAAAQKRGVSLQVVIGHVHGLKIHLELTLLRQIRESADSTNAALHQQSTEE